MNSSTVVTPVFKLKSPSEKPLYIQLVGQMKRAIKKGKFDITAPLPSLIELSRDLAISKSTPLRAYSQLAKEGLVKWEKGTGYFLIERAVARMRQ